MRVGLTYDLRSEYLAAGYSDLETAEFDQPETIEAIAGALGRLGFSIEHIGTARQLASRLTAGDRWDLVFNFCEGLHGFGRESLVPALLDTWQIPYVFSDPLSCAVTLHKGVAKHVVRGHGLATPAFAVISAPDEIHQVRLRFPLFVKPVAEGTGKGISTASRAGSPEELATVCSTLLIQYQQPVLIEEFLPGREFTVGVTGTGASAGAIGTMEVHLGPKADPGVYTFDNKEHWEGRVTYSLLTEEPLLTAVEKLAVDAWRALGCRDGGRLDIRLDAAGIPSFLEANPLAGLHPGHSDLPFICRFKGIPYDELIRRIVTSAITRTGLPITDTLATTITA
ncbi:MAG: D-alanine--D-alanine ligase [Gammaproteobacteria bacterium]|nr:D-alanine--D-alanine ligase [Gammaproteobacteria bacterium]